MLHLRNSDIVVYGSIVDFIFFFDRNQFALALFYPLKWPKCDSSTNVKPYEV